jgi:hypothetical protein
VALEHPDPNLGWSLPLGDNKPPQQPSHRGLLLPGFIKSVWLIHGSALRVCQTASSEAHCCPVTAAASTASQAGNPMIFEQFYTQMPADEGYTTITK